MKISVFTPTYNRAYILSKLYKSLVEQTVKDFEWIIVDDGSTDNTKKLVEEFIKESKLTVRYFVQKNGGKHRAINEGVKHARGKLLFIVDSDDWLPCDSLENILKVEESITDKSMYCGVCGLRGYNINEPQGTTFSDLDRDYLDITSLEREQYNIQGDKAEVFYTDILKQYPFPEYEKEFFMTEAVVWDRIAYAGYKFRYFNKIVYCGEHLDDGLIAQGMKKYIENPKGWGLYIAECDKHKKYSKRWSLGMTYSFYQLEKSKYDLADICQFLGVKRIRFFGRIMFYYLYNFLSHAYKIIRTQKNKLSGLLNIMM